MPVIGTFSVVNNGYAGIFHTLSMNAPIRFLANDRKETESAPDFRIVHGNKRLEEKLGRNDLCPCNSGKIFRRCCLKSGRF